VNFAVTVKIHGAWGPPLAGRAAPVAKAAACLAVLLVLFLPHSGNRAGVGAGVIGEKMSLGIQD
jgi:hypothetical protein